MSRRREDVGLGRDDRLMTWSSSLNIYRVVRNPIDLAKRDSAAAIQRFDFIEQLLARNMVRVCLSLIYIILSR